MSEARLSDEGSAQSLIGVRIGREAQIVLVQSAANHPERGEPAVVKLDGQLILAVVEIPASLILCAPNGAERGELIAHGASDPRVRDVIAQLDAKAAAVAQAVLGQRVQVSGARRSFDGAWVTLDLIAEPATIPDDVIDRLAMALQAAIRLTLAEARDVSSSREVADVPNSLDGGKVRQEGQDDENGKLESDD